MRLSSARNHRNPVGVLVSYRAVLRGWAFHPGMISRASVDTGRWQALAERLLAETEQVEG